MLRVQFLYRIVINQRSEQANGVYVVVLTAQTEWLWFVSKRFERNEEEKKVSVSYTKRTDCVARDYLRMVPERRGDERH